MAAEDPDLTARSLMPKFPTIAEFRHARCDQPSIRRQMENLRQLLVSSRSATDLFRDSVLAAGAQTRRNTRR